MAGATPSASGPTIAASSVGQDWSSVAAATVVADESPPMPALPGYRLIRELHRGAQGIVYLAIQTSTKREVAIKVMREGPFAGPNDRARFEREVEILARLEHPNIVTIHDSGVESGCCYFVMRYIAGDSLDAWLRAHVGDHQRVLRVFVDICDAVEAAHAAGIVHRDLKPGNIRVDAEGRPFVLDFGLAKMTDAHAGLPAMTMSGQFMGSVPWASPEQAAGGAGRLTPASDVYSLGVMLYHALTGEFPYRVEGPLHEIIERIRFAEPLRPSGVIRKQTLRTAARGPADGELDTIVLTCLDKSAARRYATAGALGADLRRYLAGEPIAAPGESIAHRWTKRVGGFIRRQPVLTYLLIAVVGYLLADFVAVPLAFRWTPAQWVFQRYAMSSPGAPASGALDQVRVVEIRRGTDVAELSRLAGVDPPCGPDRPRCLRQVHARFLECLAEAGPRAVVFDIIFRGESPYDEALAAAMRGLRERGIPVVIADDSWALERPADQALSAPIAAAATVGRNPAGLLSGNWDYYLAVEKGPVDTLASLALVGFAEAQRPGAELALRIEHPTNSVAVVAREGQREAAMWRFNASGVGSAAARNATEVGLLRTNQIAYYYLQVPRAEMLADATLEYADVLHWAADELRTCVSGKIVLVGDHRPASADVETPDGRQVWATYAHALALNQLLHDAPFRSSTNAEVFVEIVLCVAGGIALGAGTAGRTAWRVLLCTTVCAAILAACLLAAWTSKWTFSPLVAMIALVSTAELAAQARALAARAAPVSTAG